MTLRIIHKDIALLVYSVTDLHFSFKQLWNSTLWNNDGYKCIIQCISLPLLQFPSSYHQGYQVGLWTTPVRHAA